MKNPIVVITGPTASGKTAISLEIASKYKGEIICCDSMTVYRGMDIGTDKPTLISGKKPKMEADGSYLISGIRHHMLDILNPDEEFNAAIFKERAAALVSEIQSRGNVPFLVGGSLLYIDSYVYNFQMPEVEPDLVLRDELEKKTNEELFAELVRLDPDAEWVVDPNNRRRLVRALEVCISLGKPYTKSRTKKELPENILYLSVERDREELYERINTRVDEMMVAGFLDEVKKLKRKYAGAQALDATGYRQLISYICGQISEDDAISETKKSHRNFAKKQMTWLRGNPDVTYIACASEAEQRIAEFVRK